MRRPAGVTITAVLDFVGCGLTSFTSFFAVLGFAMQPTMPQTPAYLKYMQIFTVVLMLGAGAWGISTAVGLLRMRGWSRISQIVFAALLLLVSIPGMLVFLFMPFDELASSGNPQINAHAISTVRTFVMAFYGSLAALAAWWIYYFNTRAVRAEFAGQPGASITTAAVATNALPGPMGRRRPVSLTIIGALLVIGALSFPMLIVTKFPLFMFGFALTGWTAGVVALAFGSAQGAAGIGVLQLKSWGRELAIYVFSFGLVNLAASVLLPGSQDRFQQTMDSIYASMNLPPNVPQIHFPLWLMLIGSAPVLLVELYFVVTRKWAFESAEKSGMPS
jgi:hypothetical protein